ncbi:MAG TPA: hypothetical protein VG674_30050 [Amycolatopsis sp.]|nr:hypothetical protein [Amycolatopsis sp.]
MVLQSRPEYRELVEAIALGDEYAAEHVRVNRRVTLVALFG